MMLRSVQVALECPDNDEPYPHPELGAPSSSPANAVQHLGGVGGQALDGIKDEDQVGCGDIRRLHPDGNRSGYFDADLGRDSGIDHLLGPNASSRRRALPGLGRVRYHHSGTCC